MVTQQKVRQLFKERNTKTRRKVKTAYDINFYLHLMSSSVIHTDEHTQRIFIQLIVLFLFA